MFHNFIEQISDYTEMASKEVRPAFHHSAVHTQTVFFCWPLSLSSFLFFSRFVCERRCLECQHNISIPFSVCSILEFDLKTKAKANMTTVLCNMHRALVSDAKHSTCQHLYGLLKISFQFNVLYLLTA